MEAFIIIIIQHNKEGAIAFKDFILLLQGAGEGY